MQEKVVDDNHSGDNLALTSVVFKQNLNVDLSK